MIYKQGIVFKSDFNKKKYVFLGFNEVLLPSLDAQLLDTFNINKHYNSICVSTPKEIKTVLEDFLNGFCDFIPLEEIDNPFTLDKVLTYTKYLKATSERIEKDYKSYFVKSKLLNGTDIPEYLKEEEVNELFMRCFIWLQNLKESIDKDFIFKKYFSAYNLLTPVGIYYHQETNAYYHYNTKDNLFYLYEKCKDTSIEEILRVRKDIEKKKDKQKFDGKGINLNVEDLLTCVY